jgi:hypothetical protein
MKTIHYFLSDENFYTLLKGKCDMSVKTFVLVCNLFGVNELCVK